MRVSERANWIRYRSSLPPTTARSSTFLVNMTRPSFSGAQFFGRTRIFSRAGALIIYAYVEKRMLSQALAEAEITRRLYGEGPWYWSVLTYSYGRAGQSEAALRELEKLEKVSRHEQLDPVIMLWAHLGVSDKEGGPSRLWKRPTPSTPGAF